MQERVWAYARTYTCLETNRLFKNARNVVKLTPRLGNGVFKLKFTKIRTNLLNLYHLFHLLPLPHPTKNPTLTMHLFQEAIVLSLNEPPGPHLPVLVRNPV